MPRFQSMLKSPITLRRLSFNPEESRAHCLWRSRARSLQTGKRLQGARVPWMQLVRNDGKPSCPVRAANHPWRPSN